jgi:probable HAF family extracellular repeat protein
MHPALHLLRFSIVTLWLNTTLAHAVPQLLNIVPPERGESFANDMNAAGQVAAVIEDDNGNRHGVFFENGHMTALVTPEGRESDARRINDLGEIIGSVCKKDGTWSAFLFNRNDGLRTLGTLGGTNSHGAALNHQGEAVGFADTENGDWHAFLYQPGATLRDLGTLGGKISYANDINNAGQIVGAAARADGYRHAFLYDAEHGMTDLGTLGGRSSYAQSINDQGVIVGTAETVNHRWHAFIYNGSHMTDLGAVIGAGDSYATGINNAGHVVGIVRIGDDQLSFVWRDGKMALHHGGKGLYLANAINNTEQVIGATYDRGLRAATMQSNAAPYVDRGGFSLFSRMILVMVLAALAVVLRGRYQGIVLNGYAQFQAWMRSSQPN